MTRWRRRHRLKSMEREISLIPAALPLQKFSGFPQTGFSVTHFDCVRPYNQSVVTALSVNSSTAWSALSMVSVAAFGQ